MAASHKSLLLAPSFEDLFTNKAPPSSPPSVWTINLREMAIVPHLPSVDRCGLLTEPPFLLQENRYAPYPGRWTHPGTGPRPQESLEKQGGAPRIRTVPGEMSFTRRGFGTGMVTAIAAIRINQKRLQERKLITGTEKQQVGMGSHHDATSCSLSLAGGRKRPAYLNPSTATLGWVGAVGFQGRQVSGQ